MTTTPSFIGVRSLLLALAGFVLAAGAAFAQSTSVFVDCSAALSARGLNPAGALGASVRYASDSLSPAERDRFEHVLCSSFQGASKAAQFHRKDVPWLASLPVEVVNGAPGNEYMAWFKRELLGRQPSHSMQVTVQLIRLLPQDGLMWVLAHELGHGTLEHTQQQKVEMAKGLGAATAGAIVALKSKNKILKGVGVVTALAGAAYAACVPSGDSKAHELEADNFGVRALYLYGMSVVVAKSAAITTLQKNPQREGKCIEGGTVKITAHPSTAERVAAIQAMF